MYNVSKHSRSKPYVIILLIILLIPILGACRAGKERFEVTGYLGSSIDTFIRRTGVELKEQSNGVYLLENVIQVIAPEGEITSIILLKESENFTVLNIGIGMEQKEAEQLLLEFYGKENTKTINSAGDCVTYSYQKDENELYISYDIDTEKVAEISYYYLEAREDEDAKDNPNSGELIALIGDTRVYYNEAMVYLKSAQGNYESEYGKEIWDIDIRGNGNTFGDMIKDEVIKQITELKVINSKAKELGIILSEDEAADAEAFAREHYEGLSNKDIDRYFITEDLLVNIYKENMLAEKVFETETINVDTTVSDLEARQVTVQHILIYGVDFDEEGNQIPLSNEEKQHAYEKIQTLLGQAKETEDFLSLAQDNSETDEIEFTFGRGQSPMEYDKAFEQAAFTLAAGEVSDIITTNYGWHILYCVTDYNQDATIQYKENVIEQRRDELFAKLYSEWSADYDVVVNSEVWSNISFTQ